MRKEYTRGIEPTRAIAAETLKLERTLSDLADQAYGLTPAEIERMWQIAPPRRPTPSKEDYRTWQRRSKLLESALVNAKRLLRAVW